MPRGYVNWREQPRLSIKKEIQRYCDFGFFGRKNRLISDL